jgi:F-type H+-transporting ATPase subunit b
MQIIQGLFDRLEIDLGFLGAQFVIIVILYFILDFLFFKKLLFVLEHRENKTTKLEEEARKKLDEANVLAKEYKEKMDQVSADSYKELQKKKQRIEENEKENLKKTEIQINQDVEKVRKQIEKEILEKRNDVFQNQEELSATFVEKLIN